MAFTYIAMDLAVYAQYASSTVLGGTTVCIAFESSASLAEVPLVVTAPLAGCMMSEVRHS